MFTKINNTEIKILALFTKSYNKEFYIREVKKLLKISSRTAFLNLANLEKKRILESKTRGKIKLYSLRENSLTDEYLMLAEKYKKIEFLENNQMIKEILVEIEGFLKGMVLVFGSYAKNIQKNNSDIDIFIVGKYNNDEIKKISKKYRIPINVKSYPNKTFKKELQKDFLLKEIMENHIVIKGTESFVKRVRRWIN